jgi:6-phosphogluconolactonase/glucosamine-6-phosphate isomerase/deaminase
MNTIVTDTAQSVIDDLTNTLRQHLQAGERVLWLISGGSNIDTAVKVARALHGVPTETLSVSLVDERYGDIGHSNENWQQLLDQGFNLPDATLYRPLIGASRHDTTIAFGQWLGDQFGQADYTVGLLGIGADGHTAGIKAGSDATTAQGWATDYTWDDYQRITTTFDALTRIDQAFIAAIGSDKIPTIRQLIHHDIEPSIQPAQVLKRIKKSTLYTDYRENT